MSSIVTEIIMAVARGALLGLGGYFIKRGWVTNEQWSQFVTAILPGTVTTVLAVVWIVNAEIRKRKETLVARELPPGASLFTIAQRAKSAFSPSVRAQLVLIALLPAFLLNAACAGWLHVATIANDKTAIAVQALQTEVVRGHGQMCGAQKCISDKDYDRLQSKFAAAGRIGDSFTTALDHADKQAAMTQAGALLTFVQDVINNDIPNLPENVRLITSASLASAKVALAAFAPAGAPPLEK